jgi:cytochrome o ubiquinol oxidase subunit 3
MNIAVDLRELRPALDIEALRSIAPASASEAGPASKRVVVGYGVWIFLLSDIVMVSALFAA